MTRWHPAWLSLLLLAAACACKSSSASDAAAVDLPPAPPALLLDVDMGLDDARVILALPMQSEYRVVGVVTVEGSCDAVTGADNALKLLAAVDAGSIPVVVGASESLSGQVSAPPWRAMAAGLGGLVLDPAPGKPLAQDAVSFISQTLRASSAPVRVLAVGPLTNIARALAADARLAEKIHSIWVLDDLVACTGYNCTTDKQAAAQVLASGVSVTMITPSATDKLPFDAAFLERVKALEGRAAKLVVKMMENHSSGSMKLWDDAVLAGLLDGRLLSFEGSAPRRAVDVDVSAVQALLLSLWNKPAPEMP